MRFRGTGLDNNSGSQLAVTSGVVDIFGLVTNDFGGEIAVGGTAVAVFHDAVNNSGTLFVQPGGKVFMLENLAFAPPSVLGLPLAADGFGQVDVVGAAQLAGNLDIALAGGFVPLPGDQFTALSSGGLGGTTFSAVTGGETSGLRFFPVYTPTDVLIFTTAAGEKTWGVDAAGQASVASNWFGGVAPSGASESVAFTTIITGDRTIQVDAALSLARLRFDDNNNYNIAGAQAITFATAGNEAAGVLVDNVHGNGAHTISAPIVLADDLSIMQQSSGQLLLSGAFDNAAGHAITKSGSGTLTIAGPQTHGAGASLTVSAGTANVNTNAGSAAARNLSVNANSTTNFGSTQHLNNLSVGAGATATLTAGGNKVLVSNVPTIAGATGAWTGTIDLTDNDAVAQSSAGTKAADFARMYDQLNSGFAGGVWTGTGITSSTAATNATADTGLSLVDNALLGATTFSGQTVNADSLLLKYTYYGDIDMNGQVDGDDLTTFALNFGQTSGMTQVDGDIDFNGRVDGEDLTVFALNFNKGIGNPLAAGSVAAVPEPASLVLAGLGAAGVLAGVVVRRKRMLIAQRRESVS